ncbi:MAG: HAD-IA family hydrolase [Opitutaceae bacterium]
MKHVIFDADGVICIGGSFVASLEKDYGIARAQLAEFFAGPFRDCIVGRKDLKACLIEILPKLKWGGSTEDFMQFWFEREHVISPEVLACAQRLRKVGHECYIGTNQEKYRAAYLWNEMGLMKAFDGLLASCDLGSAKPNEEYFARVRERLGCTTNSLILVDDTARNVAAAQGCGWRAIHYHGIADLRKVEQLVAEPAEFRSS